MPLMIDVLHKQRTVKMNAPGREFGFVREVAGIDALYFQWLHPPGVRGQPSAIEPVVLAGHGISQRGRLKKSRRRRNTFEPRAPRQRRSVLSLKFDNHD